MKKRLSKLPHLILALLLCTAVIPFAFAATGCGGSFDLEVFIFSQPSELELYEAIVRNFEEIHGVRVRYSTAGDDYFMLLDAQLTANIPPDVFYVRPGDVRMRVNLGQVRELSGLVPQEEIESVWPQAIDAFRYDGTTNGVGELWALPKDFSQYALGFNMVLLNRFRYRIEPYIWTPARGVSFEEWEGGPPLNIYPLVGGRQDRNNPVRVETGLKLPGFPGDMINGNQVVFTFDEFGLLAYLLTHTTDGEQIFGTQFWEAMCLDSFIWGAGAEWFAQNPDGTLDHTTLATNSERFIEGYEAYMELIWHWWSAQVGQINDSGFENFQAGNLAFFPVGSWDVALFNTLPPHRVNFRLMPWPISNRYANYSLENRQNKWFARADTVGYGISSRSQNYELAAEFIRFLSTNLNVQRQLAAGGAQIPNIMEYAQTSFRYDEDRLYGILHENDRRILLQIAETNGRPVPTVFTYTEDWRIEFHADAGTRLHTINAGERETVREFVTRVTPRAQARLDASIVLEEEHRLHGSGGPGCMGGGEEPALTVLLLTAFLALGALLLFKR